MFVTSSDGTEISIAHYVKKVNDDYGTNKNILEAIARNGTELAQTINNTIFETGVDLAETIRLSLLSKEKLKRVDDKIPESTTPIIVDRNRHVIYPELLGWAIAILSSAWTEWVFTSKSNEGSRYQNDPEYKNNESRQAATVNVKLTLPYIYNSIRDALEKAKEIGNSQETDYEPKPEINPAYIKLRKE
ncbi:MAG TPA: hypothetical protein VEH06_10805 [Candidatus Bathyarchaeia archaeon]|nr:hypothetical protein [Candidatus Bathyarchaeia archaeon]